MHSRPCWSARIIRVSYADVADQPVANRRTPADGGQPCTGQHCQIGPLCAPRSPLPARQYAADRPQSFGASVCNCMQGLGRPSPLARPASTVCRKVPVPCKRSLASARMTGQTEDVPEVAASGMGQAGPGRGRAAVPAEFWSACGHPGAHVTVRQVPVTIPHALCDLRGVLLTYPGHGGATVPSEGGVGIANSQASGWRSTSRPSTSLLR